MNPVFITLGSMEIKWYSFLIFLSAFIAIYLFLREGKRFKYDKDFLFNMAFWTIIFALIGARLYYVMFKWPLYADNPSDIFRVWEGGLAIHGGIIFGIITIIVYSKKYSTNFVKILDMATVSLFIAQAIGRWGNFFNSEAYGSLTSYAKLKELHIPNFIISGMYINGNYYHPTFLYESLWCLIGFLVLIIIRRLKYVKYGQLVSFYLIWYGLGRFMIESLRTDSLMLGGFKVAQLVSVGMMVVGVISSMILSRKGKFEDLYNADADIIRF